MDNRDWIATGGVALILAASLIIWAALGGAFVTPGSGGWIYHYQGLIAGVLALAGAGATVWRLTRDQRAQEKRHKDQMTVLTREDRNFVARASRDLIQELSAFRQEIQDWNAEPLDQKMPSPALSLQGLLGRIAPRPMRTFKKVGEEDLWVANTRLVEAYNGKKRLADAINWTQPWDSQRSMIEANGLWPLNDLDDAYRELIEALKRLRTAFGLPEVASEEDE